MFMRSLFLFFQIDTAAEDYAKIWCAIKPVKKKSGTEMAHRSRQQRSVSECNDHTVEDMCRQTTPL